MSDKVGYKQPPTATRFRPGRSGNPSGRPKRRPTFRTALLEELAAVMPGKGPRGDSKLQAVIRRLVDAAIAGEARAQSLLIATLTRMGGVEDEEPSTLTAGDREILGDFVGDELNRRATDTVVTLSDRGEGDEK